MLKTSNNFYGRTVKADYYLMELIQRLLIMQAQADSFPLNIAARRKDKPLPPTSKLLTLTSYIDDIGITRVDGRIDSG